jgi:hypothetical protein
VEPCHSSLNTCATSSQRVRASLFQDLRELIEEALMMLRLHIVYVRYLLGTLSAVVFKIGAN